MSNRQEQQYHQMKGEFIGLMASVENALSLLLVGYLNVSSYYDEFSQWFIEAPIPFNWKVDLLKKMEGNNVLIETNFPNFWKDLDELQKFRNILAHSFGSVDNMLTSRGKSIPTEDVTFEALSDKLARLKELEDSVQYMYVNEIQGTIPVASSDDFEDWND